MHNGKVIVIFELTPKKEGMNDYLKHAANLRSELSKTEGFISSERFSSLSNKKKLLSLSVWENEESVTKWRNHIDHRQKQSEGHNFLFEEYHITVASVIREYSDSDRTNSPKDSNKYLNKT